MSAGSGNDNLSRPTPAIVLVVDDEPRVRALLTRWLAAEGHTCAQAATAKAAWEYLVAHEVHLVTLDIRMAGGSGIDLLHQIAKAYPDISVLMISAVQDTQTAIEALTYGACAYLVKPVERDQLIFHARRALERRQLVVDNRQYMQRLEQRVQDQTVVIRRAHEETIYRLLSASMWRDEETGMHLRRTGLLSELLAKAAGWSAAEAEEIRLAAPMHDVGKIGIPDAILRKAGKLSVEEFEIMKQHTVIGAKMLAGSSVPMLQMAETIALNHHERWDGEGYPAGLTAHAIPESACIVAIVDVYDALTHDRVYRPALPQEEALQIMQQGAGTQLDPLLLAAFFSQLSEVRHILQQNPDEAAGTEFVGATRDLPSVNRRRTGFSATAGSGIGSPLPAAASPRTAAAVVVGGTVE
jgi:putative two-component system response regulator